MHGVGRRGSGRWRASLVGLMSLLGKGKVGGRGERNKVGVRLTLCMD